MKKLRLEEKFLEELRRVPIISVAAEKTGISRQSLYRWMDEDLKFKQKVDKAIDLGRTSMCDLAESKLISNINSGNQRAIEYCLSSLHKKYYRPRKPVQHDDHKFVPIKYLEIHEYSNNDKDKPRSIIY